MSVAEAGAACWRASRRACPQPAQAHLDGGMRSRDSVEENRCGLAATYATVVPRSLRLPGDVTPERAAPMNILAFFCKFRNSAVRGGDVSTAAPVRPPVVVEAGTVNAAKY